MKGEAKPNTGEGRVKSKHKKKFIANLKTLFIDHQNQKNQRQQGAGDGSILCLSVFRGHVVGMLRPGPVSQGHASLEYKHPALAV